MYQLRGRVGRSSSAGLQLLLLRQPWQAKRDERGALQRHP
jgi:RecG-like helicase